jgi:hypothetical protein
MRKLAHCKFLICKDFSLAFSERAIPNGFFLAQVKKRLRQAALRDSSV